MSNKQEQDRKLVADLCHQQWSGWMEYLFKMSVTNEDGTVTIPKEQVDRWKRQMTTIMVELPFEEQLSDYVEADKFIRLFKLLGWEEE